VLRGITKAAIQRIASGHGFEVHEVDLPATDLARATEAFVTSATREVMPVARLLLDSGRWRDFPPGGGEVTQRVAAAYKEAVATYVRDHAELRIL
jgi:branched-subunit amino acid aminotransferase/4-amino-4-deoxychorismate lyase